MRRFLAVFCSSALAASAAAQMHLVEAEAFRELGGWKVDTAATMSVGSPYLLAHGLGRPVEDAHTNVRIERAGAYRVFVRTFDWVARWKARGAPGRFEVRIDGEPLAANFGAESADWHWHDGGVVELAAGDIELRLHDLTGFDGRCDAIVLEFGRDAAAPRHPDIRALRDARKVDGEGVEYDLVVVGGGYSGMAAAIAAARQSLRVALVQDRFVLGGNGSSEVRVWANGGTMRGKFPRLGEIVEEFADHAPDSPGAGEHYGDARKEAVCRAEPNLDLFLGHFVDRVQLDEAGEAIDSVYALDVRAGAMRRLRGAHFADCTGHGTVGALAGADYEIHDGSRLGMSNMWYWQRVESPAAWPETPWALPLEIGDFPRTRGSRARIDGKPFFKGEWFWESGFELDPIRDLERIRDWNLRAVYGAFSALKRGGKHDDAQLEWVAYVGGTRESRLLRGDVVLDREHIVSGHEFPDGCVATTWDIDLHYPKQQFAKKYSDNPFISRAEFGAGVDRQNGYPVPYRCFYSRNVPNLFMAGRNISVTHQALGTIRVMRTCGMMGEVVGKAAYLCARHATTPRGVYEKHLDELLELCRQPGAMRRASLEAPPALDDSIGKVTPYFNKGADRVDGMQPQSVGIDVATLPGIVIDEESAELTGRWSRGGLPKFVGKGYRYASPGTKARARFAFDVREAGKYEVRVAWYGHEARGQRVPCSIERAGMPALRLRVDQRKAVDGLFHSLGKFRFPAGAGAVVLSAEDADGVVDADAVQLLRVK